MAHRAHRAQVAIQLSLSNGKFNNISTSHPTTKAKDKDIRDNASAKGQINANTSGKPSSGQTSAKGAAGNVHSRASSVADDSQTKTGGPTKR